MASRAIFQDSAQRVRTIPTYKDEIWLSLFTMSVNPLGYILSLHSSMWTKSIARKLRGLTLFLHCTLAPVTHKYLLYKHGTKIYVLFEQGSTLEYSFH